jgi:hypothetical protein
MADDGEGPIFSNLDDQRTGLKEVNPVPDLLSEGEVADVELRSAR